MPAWDPTSPAFILGPLCIPTVFISYTGEALDYKTPLLRAYRLWMKQRQMFVNILICKESYCYPRMGARIFLIDRALALSRPDLMMTGRTLLDIPAKGNNWTIIIWFSIPTRALLT
jgi:glutamine synthetase